MHTSLRNRHMPIRLTSSPPRPGRPPHTVRPTFTAAWAAKGHGMVVDVCIEDIKAIILGIRGFYSLHGSLEVGRRYDGFLHMTVEGDSEFSETSLDTLSTSYWV